MSYWNDPTKIWNLPYNGATLKQGPPVQLANAGAGNVTTGAHQWKVTVVDAGGETKPGEASDTLTTNSGSNGMALVKMPDYADNNATHFNVYRTEATGSTFKLVNASPLAVGTYKGKYYLDNVADGSLGAAAPSSNTTTTPIDDPPIGRAIIEALTAGTVTDFLVGFFVTQRRWVMQTTAAKNAAVLVPGTWTYLSSGDENRWYRGDYEWAPISEATTVVSIPGFSTSMDNVQEILMALDDAGMPMTIEYGEAAYPSNRIITITSGTKVFTAQTVDDDLVALVVCQIALMAMCDVAV